MASPVYRPEALPRTQALNDQLIRLPTFPQAGRALLDQYVEAFTKALHHAQAIANYAATHPKPPPT